MKNQFLDLILIFSNENNADSVGYQKIPLNYFKFILYGSNVLKYLLNMFCRQKTRNKFAELTTLNVRTLQGNLEEKKCYMCYLTCKRTEGG